MNSLGNLVCWLPIILLWSSLLFVSYRVDYTIGIEPKKKGGAEVGGGRVGRHLLIKEKNEMHEEGDWDGEFLDWDGDDGDDFDDEMIAEILCCPQCESEDVHFWGVDETLANGDIWECEECGFQDGRWAFVTGEYDG